MIKQTWRISWLPYQSDSNRIRIKGLQKLNLSIQHTKPWITNIILWCIFFVKVVKLKQVSNHADNVENKRRCPALIGKSCSCCYRGFDELRPEYMFFHTFPLSFVVLACCIIFCSGKIRSVMSKFKLGHIPPLLFVASASCMIIVERSYIVITIQVRVSIFFNWKGPRLRN